MFKPILFLALFSPIFAGASSLKSLPIPHWDPEMTGAEYESIVGAMDVNPTRHAGSLDPVLALGKRNLDWLRFINQNRSDKISFSNKATQAGYPMDKPNNYNEAIALQKYKDVVKGMPAAMKSVLIDGAPFTTSLPAPLDEYIVWGHQIDRTYQTATRWLMMQPYLMALESRRSEDVRGYYFLNQDIDRESNFSHFETLAAPKQAQYREWLIEMCLNNDGDASSCGRAVDSARQQKSLSSLYAGYVSRSQELWKSYFTIGGKYDEALWREPKLMNIPFTQASDKEHADFIELNIQDEWRFASWQLHTNFGSSGVDVIWQPGITPHVPGLGAGTIYMDANQPLTEYDGQWTIRHEFGHVLGYPDCYVEFYNSEAGIITNYQLDTSNLMCSRQGHIQAQHIDELRRVYFQGLFGI